MRKTSSVTVEFFITYALGLIITLFVMLVANVVLHMIRADSREMKREHVGPATTDQASTNGATLILNADTAAIGYVEESWATIRSTGNVSAPENTTMYTRHKPTVTEYPNGEYIITFGAKEDE